METVLPPSHLERFRKRKAIRALLPALADTRRAAAELFRSLSLVECSLSRMHARWHETANRHDAYDDLLTRCQTAALQKDPAEMARLREEILRDHATLLKTPEMPNITYCRTPANDESEVPK